MFLVCASAPPFVHVDLPTVGLSFSICGSTCPTLRFQLARVGVRAAFAFLRDDLWLCWDRNGGNFSLTERGRRPKREGNREEGWERMSFTLTRISRQTLPTFGRNFISFRRCKKENGEEKPSGGPETRGGKGGGDLQAENAEDVVGHEAVPLARHGGSGHEAGSYGVRLYALLCLLPGDFLQLVLCPPRQRPNRFLLAEGREEAGNRSNGPGSPYQAQRVEIATD